MRICGILIVGLAAVSLSGCSQISSVFKKKPHYHTADGTVVNVGEDASLRGSPEPSYIFEDQGQAGEYSLGTEYVYADTNTNYVHADAASSAASYAQNAYSYGNYEVELFNAYSAHNGAAYSNPREAEFVKLNGESKPEDWQNCERQHRGYLFMSEYNFSLHPGFEVCMRNKGYVLSSEYGFNPGQTLSAKSAGLRGAYAYSSGYSLP